MSEYRRPSPLVVGVLAIITLISSACASPGAPATKAPEAPSVTATVAPASATPSPATSTPQAATPTRVAPTATQPAATPTRPIPTATPQPTVSSGAAARTGLTCITMQWSGEATVEVSADSSGTSQAKVTTPTAVPATATPSGSPGDSGACSESASMPSGAVPYKLSLPVKVGDVVQHPSGLIVQVTGVRTVEVDAQSDLLLVDLVAGNAGKERQYLYPGLGMEIVSGDWRWFATVDDSAAAKLAEQKITWTFGAELDPGQAAKGHAVFQVPKSEKRLAFAIQSFDSSYRVKSPSVFVSLGVRGDFTPPAIPDDVSALKPGTTYALGQAFKAPKRGVALQVNRVWRRSESVDSVELKKGEQYVLVDVTTQAYGSSPALDAERELTLVGASGQAFKPVAWHGMAVSNVQYAENTVRLGGDNQPDNQRGVVAFVGPASETSFKLKFAPLDPATMSSDSPKSLAAEAATVGVGPVAAPTASAAKPSPTASSAKQTPTASAAKPAPTQAPGASSVPAELKNVPIPDGFTLVAGSGERKTQGDVFVATATWTGPTGCVELSNFYNAALASGWTLYGGVVGDSNMDINFGQNDTSPEITLYVTAEVKDGQTTLKLTVSNGTL